MNVYVDVENIKDESPIEISKVHESAAELVRKLAQMSDIQFLKLHVKKHKKAGPKTKYGIHAQLSSSLGLFESKSWGWELATSAQDALDNLEREFMKKHDKKIKK